MSLQNMMQVPSCQHYYIHNRLPKKSVSFATALSTYSGTKIAESSLGYLKPRLDYKETGLGFTNSTTIPAICNDETRIMSDPPAISANASCDGIDFL